MYEAYPIGADRVGAFLTLASNGVDALRTIGADEAVLAVAFPTPWITLRSGTGKRLGNAPLGGTLSERNDQPHHETSGPVRGAARAGPVARHPG